MKNNLGVCIVIILATCRVSAQNEDQNDMLEVLERLRRLELKDKVSDERIARLEKTITSQVLTIHALKDELQLKDNVIASLSDRIEKLEERHSSGDLSEPQSEGRIEMVHATSANNADASESNKTANEGVPLPDSQRLQTQTTKPVNGGNIYSVMSDDKRMPQILKRQQPTEAVGFHAVCAGDKYGPEGVHQNIVFETVLLNIGSNYHNQHGIFIAPSLGLYVFSVSILSYIGTEAEVQCEIVKNGVLLGRIYGHGDSGRLDQGSITIATELQPQDEVWVRESYGRYYYGGHFTSFSGFMVMGY